MDVRADSVHNNGRYKIMEGWHSGYCTGLESQRMLEHPAYGGSSPSPSSTLCNKTPGIRGGFVTGIVTDDMNDVDPKPDCKHDWNFLGGISMDCLPPIVTSRYICNVCRTYKFVSRQEGRETEVKYKAGLV